MLFAGEPVLDEECAEMRHGVDVVSESYIAVGDFYAKCDTTLFVANQRRTLALFVANEER